MGAVFLAEDIQLRRLVALKLLRPEQSAHTGAVERFMREARAAAMVRHDNVVTIYQVGQAQGMPFIAQELLEGETLEDRLKRDRRIPIGEALKIAREIAAGLAAAHKHGLLHRDVKPSNVWLEGVVNALPNGAVGNALRGVPGTGVDAPSSAQERHGGRSLQVGGSPSRVKLLDFGLARHQQGDEQLTQSGAIVGTPAYMSPEQAQGRDLDARTDLFSLGGVLYRMLTGRLPFQGTDVLSILRSLAVDTPPPARSLNEEVPTELSALIADLLQKDREKRPASAAAVAARLAQIESTWGGPLAGPKAPSSGRRGLYVLAAAAAALLIALGVFLSIQTPYGEVAVSFAGGVKPDDVRIEVKRNGDVQIADSQNGWSIDVIEGEYSVQLKGGNDRFDINQRSVKVIRKKKTVVTVTLKPLTTVANSAANPQSPIPNPKSPPARAIAPFTAAEANGHQRVWANRLGVPVEYSNSIGMKFVLIPPGEFVMGQSAADAAAVAALHPKEDLWKRAAESSAPAHRVRLTEPFYLGVFEVTQKEYQRITGKNPAHFSAGGPGQAAVAGVETGEFPVESVDFAAAGEFCSQLSRQEQLPPDQGYRLPSEAQWEFASRAGTTSAWPTGDAPSGLALAAWHAANSGGKPHAVGRLAANPLGLFDMSGNVWEWCRDWHDPAEYARRDTDVAVDPEGPKAGSFHVLRGGSWGSEAADLRSASRATPFSNRGSSYGLRVLLPLEAVRKRVARPANPQSAIASPQSLAERMAAMPPPETNGEWFIDDGWRVFPYVTRPVKWESSANLGSEKHRSNQCLPSRNNLRAIISAR